MGMMKTAKVASLFMIAVFAAAAFAESSGTALASASDGNYGVYLGKRSAQYACRIDFTTGVIDGTVAAVPQASSTLSTVSSKLKADKATLASLAASGNSTNFNAFVASTLRADMQSAVVALAQERGNFRNYNVTNSTRESLRASFKAASDARKECEGGAVMAIGRMRLKSYEDEVGNWGRLVSGFSGKKLDTSGMQAVINGAEDNVISSLRDALESNNSSLVLSELQEHCLNNGCKGRNGTEPYNYHGYARFHIERLQAIYDRLAANGSNSSELEAALLMLNNAKADLSTVGTGRYEDGEIKAIHDSLRESADYMKEYVKDNRGQKREGMPARAEQIREQARKRADEIREQVRGFRNISKNLTQGLGNGMGNGLGDGKGRGRSGGSDDSPHEEDD